MTDLHSRWDLPSDHPVRQRARDDMEHRAQRLLAAAVTADLPEGWTIPDIHARHRMDIDSVVVTATLTEPVMGWETLLHATCWVTQDATAELVQQAKAFVDECMAGCLPTIESSDPVSPENGIPKPSKCPDTQGGDKVIEPVGLPSWHHPLKDCRRCRGPKDTVGGELCSGCRADQLR